MSGGNPIWTRAPAVLLRYPKLALSLGVGALLLAVALASVPLFLSASAGRLVAAGIADPLVTRYRAGIAYKVTQEPLVPSGDGLGPAFEERSRLFGSLASRSRYLGEPSVGVLGGVVEVSSVEEQEFRTLGRLYTGTGAVGEVEVVAGHEGPGIWLPDLVADNVHAEPGDTIALQRGGGPTIRVTVDGVYRTLASLPRRGYWLAWDPEIYPAPSCRNCPAPPQLMLADLDEFAALSARLGSTSAGFVWQAPLSSGVELSLDQARDLEAFEGRARAELTEDATELGRAFPCCGLDFSPVRRTTSFTSFLPEVIDEVERRIAVVRDPTRLLQAAAVGVALSVLAGAGAFVVSARRSEMRLLLARGMSPAALGLRSALEALPPSLAGCTVGLGAALLVVGVWGPPGPVGGGALAAAALATAAAVPVAAAAMGLTAALASTARTDRRGPARILAVVPWELPLLGLGLFALGRIQGGAGVVADPELGIRRPSGYLLLFSVALVGGAAVLAARLGRLGLRALRGRSAAWGPGRYLALHRLAGAADVAVLLLAALGLCLGSFAQARAVVGSVEATVEAKAKVFVGSDYQAWVAATTDVPPSFPLPATLVTRLPGGVRLEPEGRLVDLLAVDAETFASAAFWRDDFAGRPLGSILGELQRAGTDLPAILVGSGTPATGVRFSSGEIPIRVIARPGAFPGMTSGNPLVVVDGDTLRAAAPVDPLPDREVITELWVRGDPHQAAAALAGLDQVPIQVLTAREVQDIPYIATIIDMYGVVNALAVVAGLLVLAALLMYLQARQRSQLVSYGVSRRMGMRPSTYRRSLALELGVMLGSALVVGASTGLLAAFLMVPRLDPIPKIPPPPLLQLPWGALLVLAGVLSVAAWLGASITERRARSVHLGEVLRVAE